MSPMQRIAEAVCRVPEVQDTNVEGTMENFLEAPIHDHSSDTVDIIPEANQPTEDNTPATIEQPLNESDNIVREPEIIAK